MIEGMFQIFESHKPVIFVECSDIGREKVWTTLKSLGYTCFQANNPSRMVSEFEEYKHADFLWIPRDSPNLTG